MRLVLRSGAKPQLQEIGRRAPGGRQRVVSAGALFARILTVFTSAMVPGLEIVIVIVVPTGRRRVISGFSDTVPRVLRLVNVLRAQPFGQRAVTLEPRGWLLTVSETTFELRAPRNATMCTSANS